MIIALRQHYRRIAEWRSLWGAVLLCAAACARPPDAPQSRTTQEPCTHFDLLTSDAHGIRAELVFRASIADRPCRVQLDTGSPHSWVYGSDLVRGATSPASVGTLGKPDPATPESARLEVSVASVSLAPQRVFVHPPVSDPHGVSATLGTDFLLGKLTSIDFAHQRFCVHDLAVDRPSRWPEARFVPVEMHAGRLVLSWAVVGGAPLRCFLDTGTGAIPFIVSRERWQRLTGRKGPDPNSERYHFPGLHQELIMVGAPLATTLSLAGITVDGGSQVFFIENMDGFPAQWPNRVDGLCGNALFSDRRIVIDARRDRPLLGVSALADR